MTGTVHLVYPGGPASSCPDAIGRNLSARLSARWPVRLHAWNAIGAVRPAPGDVLLGHPHPVPGTVFRASSRLAGWRRVLALAPFVPDPAYVGFHESVLDRCDLFLAITGSYWFGRTPGSAVAHWRPKMVHLDLAVDRADFPRVKGRFSRPGDRRFLYVGGTGPAKNVGYLSRIAGALPGTAIAWMGRGGAIAGLEALGFADFRDAEARRTVARHDFLLTVGRADANPATVLEAMSWGLVPVCTPQSGYQGLPGVVNVPLDDAAGAAEVLRRLQDLPEAELERMRRANDEALDRHFHWDRFAAQVVEAIDSGRSPPLGSATRRHRMAVRLAALRGPASPLRPSLLATVAGANLARWARSLRSGPAARTPGA